MRGTDTIRIILLLTSTHSLLGDKNSGNFSRKSSLQLVKESAAPDVIRKSSTARETQLTSSGGIYVDVPSAENFSEFPLKPVKCEDSFDSEEPNERKHGTCGVEGLQ